MRQSENLTELFAALSVAQGQLVGAKKESENPAFKSGKGASKYADLSSVIAAIRDPLAKNGLAYIQLVTVRDKVLSVETMLTHKSGQFIAETLDLPILQGTPQGIGSAITYGRRYSLMALVGVASEDDDDGNEASRRGPPDPRQVAPAPPPTPAPTTITEAQATQLGDAITALGKGTWPAFAQAWQITRLGELMSADYPAAYAQLQARQAALKATNGKAPPNPNATASTTPEPHQIAPAFDWDGYRDALNGAETADAADAVFDAWVEKRRPRVSLEEEDEAQKVLRERCDKFFIDGPGA